ncbi:hypothetical protein AMTR_s00047p00118220 [Amborella trichopoda]|uniref:DEK-C domain-containing protein n=1 Tax=Amborella trichopoda TaxID=13333 RepID=U5D696_AMBTC|nr:hypothetical protein AMTR_s00047p00118220 [Amborella trichopoda]
MDPDAEETKSNGADPLDEKGKGAAAETTEANEDEEKKKEIDSKEQEGDANNGVSKEETKETETKGTPTTKKRGRRSSKASQEESTQEISAKKKRTSDVATPATRSIERPSRERKSIERFIVYNEKEPSKEFSIEKGHGTLLKDIPNVAYKLSKRKSDDVLKMLHVILYGRRGKSHQVKSNISQFSGFVWAENEEKQRSKVKEKLDKCVKEKLLQFCDLFDLRVAKVTSRKEELVAKILEFLQSPHATTDVILAEKEQRSKKRKRQVKGSVAGKSRGTPSRSSAKKKRSADTPKSKDKKGASKVKDDNEEEDEDEEMEEVEGEKESASPDEAAMEESDKGSEEEEDLEEQEKAEEEQVEEEEEEKVEEEEEERGKHGRGSKRSVSKKETAKKSPSKKASTPKKVIPSKPSKSPSKSASKKPKSDDKNDASPRSSRKKKDKVGSHAKSSTVEKSPTKEKSGRRKNKGKAATESSVDVPSEEDLRKAICDILKEVDFNTATFTDILKQLAAHFNTDLTERKSAVKIMIQDELTKLAEDEDEESDANAGKGAPSEAPVKASKKA